jgi:hypothetical protein
MTTDDHWNAAELTAFPGARASTRKKTRERSVRNEKYLGKPGFLVPKTRSKEARFGPKRPDSDASESESTEFQREKGPKAATTVRLAPFPSANRQ